MVNKVLVIIEPNFYGREFLSACKALAVDVVVVVSDKNNPIKLNYNDQFKDKIIANTLDATECIKVIKNSSYYKNGEIQSILPGYEYVLSITAKVAEELNIEKVNSYKSMEGARHKDKSKQIWKKHNVSTAQSVKVTLTKDQFVEALKVTGVPAIIKPVDGSCSENVILIGDVSEVDKIINKLSDYTSSYMGMQVRQEFLIETYIGGQEYSVELFLDNGNVAYSSVTEKETTPLPYFTETMHTVPAPINIDEENELINTAISGTKAIGILYGAVHVELKLFNNKAYIIELNGRAGGDSITTKLLPYTYNIDFYNETIRQIFNKELLLNKELNMAHTIAYFTAPKVGILKKINNLDILENNQYIVEYNISAKIGDKVNLATFSDERLGYVIIKANTASKSKEIASDILEKLEFIVE